MQRNKNIIKKMHYRSYESKNLVGCYRQSVLLNSYYIRALESFNFSKVQIANMIAILTKVIKLENKKLLKIQKVSDSLNNQPVNKINLKVHVYPYFSLTIKARESRMGKGKGTVESMYFPVKKGLILFELSNVSYSVASYCFIKLYYKLGCLIRLENKNY